MVTRRQRAPSPVVDQSRGERMREARERAGIQQQHAADRLGVSRGTLRRWENGHWLSAKALQEVATLYGVAVESLRDDGAVPMSLAAPVSNAWPQWARERWAEVQLELVRRGATDAELAFGRSLVLSSLTEELLPRMSEAAVRVDVEAGIAGLNAWFDARHKRK